MTGPGLGQDGVQLGRVGVGAQLGTDAGIAHGARDECQRLEMVDTAFLGREQSEHQVDGLTVDGIVVIYIRSFLSIVLVVYFIFNTHSMF